MVYVEVNGYIFDMIWYVMKVFVEELGMFYGENLDFKFLINLFVGYFFDWEVVLDIKIIFEGLEILF